MCGFLGEIGHKLSEKEVFLTNLSRSRHRGPDQQDSWTDGDYCQLGFNRLSILDLSENGKQPLLSPSGRYAMVFNGEIYNYKALQQKYGIADRALRSSADSEILAHLLDQLSICQLAQELNGMFAIAVYDREIRKLSLLRDFAGIKPLFYGIASETVVFASQFDQVFHHPAFQGRLEVDAAGLYDYAALGYMAAPRTVFRNIYQCQPGELVEIDAQRQIKQHRFRYWQPETQGIQREEAPAAYQELDALFSEVVRDQLVADVPVGVFLSGGIDSPLVAAYAQQHKADITAYTIGVKDKALDESGQASIYAQALGLQHKVVTFGEGELLQYNDQHFQSLTEPFGDYSSLPTYLITKIARADNTVMLSGDGGDELFWGYPRFLNVVHHFNWFRYPKTVRKVGAGLLRRTGRRVSYAVSHVENIEDWILGQQSHNNPDLLKKLLPDLTYSSDVLACYTPAEAIQSETTLLQWLRWNEFYAHMQRVLAKVDRTSMGNSLEVRVPFLDQRIIDFAWQLNPGLGIRHQNPKYLLKYTLQKKLGATPINQAKLGFSVPVRAWLRQELKQDVQQHLLDIPLFGEVYWNKMELEKSLKAFLEEDQGNEWGIWILYALQKWARRYDLT